MQGWIRQAEFLQRKGRPSKNNGKRPCPLNNEQARARPVHNRRQNYQFFCPHEQLLGSPDEWVAGLRERSQDCRIQCRFRSGFT